MNTFDKGLSNVYAYYITPRGEIYLLGAFGTKSNVRPTYLYVSTRIHLPIICYLVQATSKR